jgi:hypothetical protein
LEFPEILTIGILISILIDGFFVVIDFKEVREIKREINYNYLLPYICYFNDSTLFTNSKARS